jgi:hypothetical protein
MAKRRKLGFLVDKLTNSIENTLTGDKFETEIIRLAEGDAPLLRKLKWEFDWTEELLEPQRKVYALTTKENPLVWQGLTSSEDLGDHIFMHLIESAPFNVGREKLYDGVAGNLVAFLCKTSFEKGYHGVVAFEAKTRLIKHYEETLKAQRISGSRMFIDTREAYQLVIQYFPEFDNDRPRKIQMG